MSPNHGGGRISYTLRQHYAPADVLNFLRLLASTDPTLPGFAFLSVLCDIPTAEAADLLCAVLRHHPALEELELLRLPWAPCGSSPPAAIAFRALPQLTAITSLTLSAPCLPRSLTEGAAEAAAEAVQALAAAISALPRLHAFHLRSLAPEEHQTRGRPGRRQRETAPPRKAPAPARPRSGAGSPHACPLEVTSSHGPPSSR